MQSSRLLTTLTQQLNNLAGRVDSSAGTRVQQSRFDHQLFHSRGTRLADYLAESRLTLSQLEHAVEQNRAERVAWLAQRLIDQMTALAREMATQDLHRHQPKAAPATDYYARQAEHQDYERRLIIMIRDRDSLRAACTDTARVHQLQREVAALEGRLARCRQALARIEKVIERRENGLDRG